MFDDLVHQFTGVIHMGMAGIPWFTNDTGGLHGGNVNSPQFQEPLMPRRDFSCFLPVMRDHGDRFHKRGGQEVHEQIKA